MFSIIWYYTVSDSPQTNTRISEEELKYIEKGIPENTEKVRIQSVRIFLKCAEETISAEIKGKSLVCSIIRS